VIRRAFNKISPSRDRRLWRWSRALSCLRQALFGLVWFGKREDLTVLGAGFGISRQFFKTIHSFDPLRAGTLTDVAQRIAMPISALKPTRGKIENRKIKRSPRTTHDPESLAVFAQAVLSRAKCAAYMAISAPKTLPAITSLTK